MNRLTNILIILLSIVCGILAFVGVRALGYIILQNSNHIRPVDILGLYFWSVLAGLVVACVVWAIFPRTKD